MSISKSAFIIEFVAFKRRLIGLYINRAKIIPNIIEKKVDIPKTKIYKSYNIIENSFKNILAEL